MRSSPDQVLRLVAFGLGALAALFAAAELTNAVAPEGRVEPLASDDPLRAELSRCRMVTPEKLDTDTVCRTAWAEQRRRFLGLPSDDPGKE